MDRETEFCMSLLSRPGAEEVLSWLKKGHRYLGEFETTEESVRLAEEIYRAGAARVTAVDVESYPDLGMENTGKLVIELPQDTAARPGVFKWVAQIAEAQGYDADIDCGQKYLFVMLD